MTFSYLLDDPALDDDTPRSGLFIALDGSDGSGKSTQLLRLEAYLHTICPEREIVRLKHPTDRGLGGIIRRLVLGRAVSGYNFHASPYITGLNDNELFTVSKELCEPSTENGGELPDSLASYWLFFAEYLHAYALDIMPALDRGAIVIYDRSYFTSTLAYVYGESNDIFLAIDLVELMDKYTLPPDKVLVLDVPYDVAQSRLSSRASDGGEITHYDGAPRLVYDRRRKGFEFAAIRYPFVQLLDGSGTLEMTEEAICHQVDFLLDQERRRKLRDGG